MGTGLCDKSADVAAFSPIATHSSCGFPCKTPDMYPAHKLKYKKIKIYFKIRSYVSYYCYAFVL